MNLSRIELSFGTMTPTEPSAGAVSALVRAQNHEEEYKYKHDRGGNVDRVNDPNVEPGDSRLLVPLAVQVQTMVNLLEERLFGPWSLRAESRPAGR